VRRHGRSTSSIGGERVDREKGRLTYVQRRGKRLCAHQKTNNEKRRGRGKRRKHQKGKLDVQSHPGEKKGPRSKRKNILAVDRAGKGPYAAKAGEINLTCKEVDDGEELIRHPVRQETEDAASGKGKKKATEKSSDTREKEVTAGVRAEERKVLF